MSARTMSGDDGRSWKLVYVIPLAVLVAVVYGAPIWGLVTVLSPWGFSQTGRTAQEDITVAGVIFLVALVTLLIHSAVWLRHGRPSRTALGGASAMAFSIGSITAFVAVVRGVENSVPMWQLSALPVIACAVLGGVVLTLVRRARGREASAG